MKHDELADVFAVIKNREEIGKSAAVVPASNLAGEVLRIMQQSAYVGKWSRDSRVFKVELLGKINDCKVIKPRFSARKGEFTKWEKRFLPAQSLGILIVSTPKGVMDHRTARECGLGGNLLGYVY